MASKEQVFGGAGGKLFDDLELHPTIIGIRGLYIRCGNSIDSIQATYQLKDGSVVVGPRHGGLGGQEKRFMLNEGEVLIRMEGKTSGVLVDQLTFYSNQGKQYGPYGRSCTTPFETQEGVELTSFFGRSGKLLDAIGVRFMSRNQLEPSDGNFFLLDLCSSVITYGGFSVIMMDIGIETGRKWGPSNLLTEC